MSIIDAWKTCVLQKYADFSGRARRAEYWGFVLVNVIAYVALLALMAVADAFLVVYILFALAILIPSIAAAVRRLHDTGKSGWFLLIAFIPIVGSIILLVFMFTDSERGVNDYGPSPKYGAG